MTKELPIRSEYISAVVHLSEYLRDTHNNFEMVMNLTNKDFDNRSCALARSKSNPYVLRNIAVVKGKHAVTIIDFKNNLIMSVIDNKIDLDPIGKRMKAYLSNEYNLSYDSRNPPVYNEPEPPPSYDLNS